MPDNDEDLGDTLTRPLLEKARNLGFSSSELERLYSLYLLHPEHGEIKGSHSLPHSASPSQNER